MSFLKPATLVAAIAMLLVALTGCGGSSTSTSASSATYTQIIDVRTPEEFASGHIAGAKNVDIRSATFDSDIAALAKDGNYLVYCRSGQRAGQAVTKMSAIGLKATNGAGLADMTSNGYKLGD